MYSFYQMFFFFFDEIVLYIIRQHSKLNEKILIFDLFMHQNCFQLKMFKCKVCVCVFVFRFIYYFSLHVFIQKKMNKKSRAKKKYVLNYLKIGIIIFIIPVMAIFADHLLVPSKTLCLTAFIWPAWLFSSTPNTALSIKYLWFLWNMVYGYNFYIFFFLHIFFLCLTISTLHNLILFLLKV